LEGHGKQIELYCMASKTKNAIVDITCFLLIVLFVYAAATKLLDFQKFRIQLGQSPLLTSFAGWFAWLVPGTELLIAGFLAIPRLRVAGLYLSFSLMTMFTVYIIMILKYSEYIPCSCGGILQTMGWGQHLVFNIIYTLVALTGILLTEPSYFIAIKAGHTENL
jgi:uncharacterized membrane protein YphA (DoxX/SURF4 family)